MNKGLTGEAAGGEKGLLVLGRGAAEGGVTVRETAEATDDVGVNLGELHSLRVGGVAAQAETEIAALNVARVFEQYEMTRDLEGLFDQARRAAAG